MGGGHCLLHGSLAVDHRLGGRRARARQGLLRRLCLRRDCEPLAAPEEIRYRKEDGDFLSITAGFHVWRMPPALTELFTGPGTKEVNAA